MRSSRVGPLGITLILLVGLVVLAAACTRDNPTPSPAPTVTTSDDPMTNDGMEKSDDAMMSDDAMSENSPDQQLAPHFAGSDPQHGAKLTQIPAAITLEFNLNLNEASTITVTRDGNLVNTSEPSLSANKLSTVTVLVSPT